MAFPRMQLFRNIGRRALSTQSVAWGDSGPLFTEHMIFSGSGLDDGVGEPKLAVLLHGLLGAGRNLRTYTMELFQQVARRSDATWTAVLVDLRNHGKSSDRPGLFPPHDLHAAAQDVIDTVAASWPGQIDALIGHSLGGKVALEVTRLLAETQVGAERRGPSGTLLPPKQVWCLDSVPGKVPDPATGTSSEVLGVLRAVSEIPLPIPSREWLYEELARRGHKSKTFRQWLASNLKLKRKGEYVWTFDVDGADEMFRSYRNTEYWDLLRSPPKGTEIHVVKAMKGGRWDSSMAAELDRVAKESDGGRTHVHEFANGGHWLHAEDPKGVAELLKPHILKLG